MSTSTSTAPTAGRAGRKPARPGRRRHQPRWRKIQNLKGLAFTLPFYLGFLVVTVIPIIVALQQSFFARKTSGLGLGNATVEFAGLDNYIKGLTSPAFWEGMLRVTLFAIVMIPIGLATSLIMALLLDAVTGRRAKYFRMGLLVPYMVPGIVATLIWLFLYSPTIGPLTALFESIGIDVDFFSKLMVWPSMGNIVIWSSIGFNMLLMYGVLRTIPADLFDAARVDGASELRIALSIKVPFLRGILVLTTMLSIIGTLQIFNEPVLFRSVSPETVSESWVPVQMIYFEAFQSNDPYYAAALSVILASLIGVVSFVFYKFTNRPES